MNIIVNGQEKTFHKELSLMELLESLSLVGKVMAAAVNMEIIKQDKWEIHTLHNGDKIELLDFVGGG